MSITNVLRDVSEYDLSSATYFGDPGPWALGVDHAFGVCQEVGLATEVDSDGVGLSAEASEGLSLGQVDSI